LTLNRWTMLQLISPFAQSVAVTFRFNSPSIL
jgi:hypothetical protein